MNICRTRNDPLQTFTSYPNSVLDMPVAFMYSIRIMSPTIERKREKLSINTERNLSTPCSETVGEVIRFEAGLIAVLEREKSGTSGVGTGGLIGKVDGCKGCDGIEG